MLSSVKDVPGRLRVIVETEEKYTGKLGLENLSEEYKEWKSCLKLVTKMKKVSRDLKSVLVS